MVDDFRDLKNVIWRNDFLVVRYLVKRNDISFYYKVERVIVDEIKIILFVFGGNVLRVFMMGRIVRLYVFLLINVEIYDDRVVEFGVVYYNFNYLVFYLCIIDEIYGYFDVFFFLFREKDDIDGLKRVFEEVYRELFYVFGNIVMIE